MIGFRLPDEAKAKLTAISEAQHRALANLVRAVVLTWLEKYEENPAEANGWLLGENLLNNQG